MAWAWNDAITEPVIYTVAFQQLFWKVFNDRRLAIPTTVGPGAEIYFNELPLPQRGGEGMTGGAWSSSETTSAESVNARSFQEEFTTPGITRSGTTATVTSGYSGRRPRVGDHLIISGATQTQYNGEKTITSVPLDPADTSVTFEVTGSPATPATGTRKSYLKEGSWSVRLIQDWLSDIAPQWYRDLSSWTAPNASIPPAWSLTNAGLSGFRRLKPRTISSDTPGATDSDGNTIAVGMRAYTKASNRAGGGEYHECTAVVGSTSTWVSNFTTKTITSLTRTGGTATATVTSHGYTTGQTVRIDGVRQSAYNGLFTITVTTANAFTFTVTGSPATPATANGTMTATRQMTEPVDVMDSNAAAPNHCATGRAMAGDYFGPWLFEDLMDCFNALETLWTGSASSNTSFTGNGATDTARTGSGASYGAAATAYAAATPTATVDGPNASVSAGAGTSHTLTRGYAYARATFTRPSARGLVWDVKFYGLVVAGGTSTTKTYGNQGDAFLPALGPANQYHLLTSETSISQATWTGSTQLGTTSSGAAPGPAQASNNSLGYAITTRFVLLTPDFAEGPP